MQQIVDAGEIKARAQAIGLGLTELAAAAGLHPATVYRAVEGNDVRVSTVVKLRNALIARERQLAAHLLALHPDIRVAA